MKFTKLFAFLIICLLFISISGGLGYASSNGMNYDVLSSSLSMKMKKAGQNEVFNLIVQFEDEVTNEDLRVLKMLDFEVVETFKVIPGVHAFAKKEGIISLSNYHRIYWIETNDRIKYNLDVSTSVINATNTWNRIVKDFGAIKNNINGRGVTVVVDDTGIDAKHPDLDYEEKVILNLKKDVDHPGGWKEMENTDTTFGHGTHCAGIVGGTGEASAGARRGVAPGVSLIGLSIGDPWETNEVGGLEWVYENSKPNANPYNIRVVTNSWGYEEQIDAENKDAVMEVTKKLSYDNNIVVVFAAGNDGEEDHDGHMSTTNPYGNVPCAISVAASQREGDGLADFSSRGDKTLKETWPDIMAPGVRIWSARSSSGFMGISDTENPYYIPASGTSMATPHIAGVVALLFQAAPSLKMSQVHDDTSTPDERFLNDPETVIHEAEYILEVTADFLPSEEGNGVPGNFSIGLEERPHDFAQGYGLVNVERAVGLALTLEKLRDEDRDITVHDALRSYLNVLNDTIASEKTDVLAAEWNGEYSLHHGQNEITNFNTSLTRYVFVATESNKLILDLSFTPINLDEFTVGTLTMTMDSNDDGATDWSGSLTDSSALNGQRHFEIDISQGEFASMRGNFWAFSIYGYAVGTVGPLNNIVERPIPFIREFKAPTIEYSNSVQQVLDLSSSNTIFVDYQDFRPIVAQLYYGKPTAEYEEGIIEMNTYEYNLSRAFFIEEIIPVDVDNDVWLLAVIMDIVLAFIIIGALIRRFRKESTINARISSK
ncbi:MAG: S8 family serine peptidase [Thermoplasmata archaeon]|nr:MAG: S8 family serine peptidase [Thermoplasmata archaeon]